MSNREDLLPLLEKIADKNLYYGAQSTFAEKLAQKYKDDKISKNICHRMLNGDITFERTKWWVRLDEVIQIAREVIAEYDAKARYEAKSSLEQLKTRQLIQPDGLSDSIRELIEEADEAFNRGEVLAACQIVHFLYERISLGALREKSPYFYGKLHLTYGKIQMQFGQTEGTTGSLRLANESIQTFSTLHPRVLQDELFRSFSLHAHVLRQLNRYEEAFDSFTNNALLVESLNLEAKERESILMNTLHQQALTLLSLAGADHIEKAAKLIKQSNNWFEHSNDELWYAFSKLREAEIMLHSKNTRHLESAEKILDTYSHHREFSKFTPARMCIFYRINVLRFLKTGQPQEAKEEFKAALRLAKDKGFQHEINTLQTLYRRFEVLQLQFNYADFDTLTVS